MTEPLDDKGLHPALQAALERDGVSLARLATLVGFDDRTVRSWGVDAGTEERAAKYRRLEDFIAGRSYVDTDGTPPVLVTGEAEIALANVNAMLKQMRVVRDAIDGGRVTLGALIEFTESAVEAKHISEVTSFLAGAASLDAEKRVTPDLTDRATRAKLGSMLSTNALQSVAREVDQNIGPGGMVTITVRVPPGFKERVRAAAEVHGMDFSEYWRTIGWMLSEPPPKPMKG